MTQRRMRMVMMGGLVEPGAPGEPGGGDPGESAYGELYFLDPDDVRTTVPDAPTQPQDLAALPTTVTSESEFNDARANGAHIIITNSIPSAFLNAGNNSDMLIQIPDPSTVVRSLVLGHLGNSWSAPRVRIEGPGTIGLINQTQSSHDLTLVGLKINSSAHDGEGGFLAFDGVQRTAIIHCVIRGGRPGVTSGGAAMFIDNALHTFLGGCNVAGDDQATQDNWALRREDGMRLYCVDTFLASGGHRTTLRGVTEGGITLVGGALANHVQGTLHGQNTSYEDDIYHVRVKYYFEDHVGLGTPSASMDGVFIVESPLYVTTASSVADDTIVASRESSTGANLRAGGYHATESFEYVGTDPGAVQAAIPWPDITHDFGEGPVLIGHEGSSNPWDLPVLSVP